MKKILHIIENFNGQATEKWLYQVMEEMHRKKIQFNWTFFCTLNKNGRMDKDVSNLGGNIIYSTIPLKNKILFLINLRKVIINGKYDIIHCHHDIISAFYFLSIIGIKNKKKIIHIHNTTYSLPTKNLIKIIIFRPIMQLLCILIADKIVGVSTDALNAFMGKFWIVGNSKYIIHCGINLQPFYNSNTKDYQIQNFPNFAKEEIKLLFVGRMIPYKNPKFVIEILEYLLKTKKNYRAIFVGTGPEEITVMNLARKKGIENHIEILGWREDVPMIMMSCDILIWPGLETVKEGLGLGIIEAQAACIPILMSRNVPKEAIIIPQLVSVLPISIGAKIWADNCIRVLKDKKISKDCVLSRVENSTFSISSSTKNILNLYEN